LQRPADVAELNYWTGQLNQAEGALVVLRGILSSPEYTANAANGTTKRPNLPNGADAPRPLPMPIVAVGADAGAAPLDKVYDADTGAFRFQFFAYDPSFTGGVRVALAELTPDNIPDIITAPGPGMSAEIRIFDGLTGARLSGARGEFLAYSAEFQGGAFVAAGDVNGDHFNDIVVGGRTPATRLSPRTSMAIISMTSSSGQVKGVAPQSRSLAAKIARYSLPSMLTEADSKAAFTSRRLLRTTPLKPRLSPRPAPAGRRYHRPRSWTYARNQSV
jgi:hypothetical protein